MSLQPHIRGISSFLPNDPVPNDAMEELLGRVGTKSSRARRTVLRSNGIVSRHYALDPSTGLPSHTCTELAVEAIHELTRKAGLDLSQVQSLVCGTSTPDELMPHQALMVQGELELGPIAVASTAGTCLCGLTALKYAAQSVACGDAESVVATAAELASAVTRAANFPGEWNHEEAEGDVAKEPILAFGQDFLRWMLSDGAGAMWIAPGPSPTSMSLEIEWIDIVSFAGELESCMYMGATKREDGSLEGWRSVGSLERAVESGAMNLTQDVRLLGREISKRAVAEGLGKVLERRSLTPDQVDWFVPHYSSEFFRQEVFDRLGEIDFEIPYERWFTNLTTKGNTGSASIFIMLDELFASGRLKPGQRILCFVPESARFSVGYALLRVAGPTG